MIIDPVTNLAVGWWVKNDNEELEAIERIYQECCATPPEITTLEQVQVGGHVSYHFVFKMSPELRSDRRVLLDLIDMDIDNVYLICVMGENVQMDVELVKHIVNVNPIGFLYVRPEMKDNGAVVMELAQVGSPYIRYASGRLRNSRQLATIAIARGAPFHVFGKEVRNDEALLQLALRTDSEAWNYASPRLRLRYKPWYVWLWEIWSGSDSYQRQF